MNYLAHIFLSGSDRRLQVGNFVGDFVKGSRHEAYPGKIQQGILLHRDIDSFTDSHPVFLDTVQILRPVFDRYSGIMTDMYFDYFLASDFEKYSEGTSLSCFATDFYLSALLNYPWLPRRVKSFIFHFVGTNRLAKYASYDGLHESLSIMSRVKSDAINPDLSIAFLKENEDALRQNFHLFMPEVIAYVAHRGNGVLKQADTSSPDNASV